jgi:hypothetical protein
MQAFSAQNARHANRGGGLCKAGDILKQQHGDLLVSRHKLRQAEGVSLVREKREAGNQILGFAIRVVLGMSHTIRAFNQRWC